MGGMPATRYLEWRTPVSCLVSLLRPTLSINKSSFTWRNQLSHILLFHPRKCGEISFVLQIQSSISEMFLLWPGILLFVNINMKFTLGKDFIKTNLYYVCGLWSSYLWNVWWNLELFTQQEKTIGKVTSLEQADCSSKNT